jgi:hypothetical protein
MPRSYATGILSTRNGNRSNAAQRNPRKTTRTKGKFELALPDFEAADVLEPEVPLVLSRLRSIRGVLGI